MRHVIRTASFALEGRVAFGAKTSEATASIDTSARSDEVVVFRSQYMTSGADFRTLTGLLTFCKMNTG